MTGPHPDPLDWQQAIEPPAAALLARNNMDIVVQVSIALSLKRMADTLDKVGFGNPDAANIIHHFVTNLAHEAGRAFQGGVERERRS